MSTIQALSLKITDDIKSLLIVFLMKGHNLYNLEIKNFLKIY